MSKSHVNQNVSVKGKNNGWGDALSDAEAKLEASKLEVLKWKQVVMTCKERIAEGAPWPENEKTGRAATSVPA